MCKENFGQKKILVQKNFGPKKFWSKKFGPKSSGPKRIWVQKVANGSIMRPTATPVLVPKIGGGMTFQTMSYDFPNNVPGYL